MTKFTHAACASLAIAFLAVGAPSAQAANQWGEDDSNPGEFGLLFGSGTWNCRHWLSSRASVIEGSAWILGWWTATNGSNTKNHFVGAEVGESGIIARIKERCKAQPGWALTNAVALEYFQLGRADKKSKK